MTWRDVLDGSADYAIVRGDALDSLRALPDECVQVCVTSPPYYGLRDYGLPPSVWGGRRDCEHTWGDTIAQSFTAPPGTEKQASNAGAADDIGRSSFCIHCGAWRGCLGLEPTPAMFLDHLVELFREVRRVLRRDGTCWVNLGDSYSGSGKGPSGHNGIGDQAERQGFVGSKQSTNPGNLMPPDGKVPDCWSLKPKDLMMMPARLAIRLQEDGWYLRSEITWCKSSAMPESVRDRPTSATERIYLLSKSAQYFYDADAVREKSVTGDNRRPYTSNGAWEIDGRPTEKRHGGEQRTNSDPSGANLRNFWLLGPEPSSWDYCNTCGRLFVGADRKAIKTSDRQRVCPCGASDWVAHYATFPTELARRPIKAGTSAKGACATCGAPWVRVVERESGRVNLAEGLKQRARNNGVQSGGVASVTLGVTEFVRRETIGWQPSCRCEYVTCTACGFVVESRYEKKQATTKHDVRSVRNNLPAVEESSEVLRSEVLRDGSEEATGQDMRPVRGNVPSEQLSHQVLQQDLLEHEHGEGARELSGLVQDEPGIHHDSDAVASGREQDGVCVPASASSRAEDRQDSPAGRGRSPSQRDQGRQPTGESRCSGEAGSRQAQEADVYGDVSGVSSRLPDEGQCPRCTAPLARTVADPVPCTVLDIFSGSATTGRVARQLGRRYIGLELSDRYANASEALLAREDRPLLDAAPLPIEQQANLFAI